MTDQWARRKRKRRNRGSPPLGIPLVQDRVLNGLNRQTRRGLLLKVQMMTSHQLCLGHHPVSACAEAPRFPSIAHTEHRVRRLRRGVGDPTFHPRQTPNQGIRLLRKLTITALSLLAVRTPHRAILPWARYHRIDPLGLNQYARWNDPLLATLVITPG